MTTSKNICIQQGAAFALPVRFMNGDLIIRKPISGIDLTAGAPRLSVANHGCPNGWPTAVTLVKGMTPLNASEIPPRPDDYHVTTVIDSGVLEYNAVNPVDAAGKEWPAYQSGGFVQWFAPMPLSGKSARMVIRDKVGGRVLASTEAEHAPLNVIRAEVDDTNKVVLISLSALSTAAFGWRKGVYDIELFSTTDDAQRILQGEVSVSREVSA